MRLRTTGLFGAFIAMLLVVLPAGAEVLVAGSSTILPIVKRVAESFSAQTGIRVHATGGGSGQGILTAAAGGGQVGMVSRALRSDEAQLLVAHTIGLDGVAVFVNESNAIAGLSAHQVTDIYAGRVNQWRDIDPAAPDGRIVRVGKWTDRSTRGLFDGFFALQGQDYPAGTHMIGANIASILYVSIDPQSIGYVSLGSLDHARQFGAPVRVLPIDGVVPSMENVASGRYPYRRPLNLVTRGVPQGEALRFIEWLKSPDGQQAVVAEGFLPITGNRP